MPQALIVAVIKYFIVAVITTLVSGIISAAYGKRASLKQQGGSDRLANTTDIQVPIAVVYGETLIGGNRVFVSSHGNDNEYLNIVLTLGEGEFESCVDVYLDGKSISTFGSYAYYEFFNGSASQAMCSTLNNADSSWSDPLKNTAYLYVRLKYSEDKFVSIPTITAKVNGRKVYDPRSAQTVYSNNAALCFYDYINNTRFGGGMGVSYWDENSIIDTADWCDTKGYTINGSIKDVEYIIDAAYKMLTCFKGAAIWSGGEFKLIGLEYSSPVMSFNEDNIKARSFKWEVPSIQDRSNTVRSKYPNKDKGYVVDDMIVQDTALVSSDGENREMTIELPFVDTTSQASKISTYQLERQKLNTVFTFVTGPEALVLEPADTISVSHSLPGWTNKICRVQSLAVTAENEVMVSFFEDNVDVYDDTVNVTTHNDYSTNLPNPFDAPDEVTNVSFLEEEYFNKDVSYTRLKVTYTKPLSPFWDRCEVWVNAYGTGWVHRVDVRDSFTLEPVKEGAQYQIKLLSVSLSAKRQDSGSATIWSYNVVGKNTPPDDVTGFQCIPQSDTIILMWDAVTDVDHAGYEIRKGTNWNGGIFIGFTKAVTFQLNGVAPGDHTYMIKSRDTKGVPSVNFDLASATVYGPASYTIKNSPSPVNDFSTGTHNGTERVVDGTYGAILRINRDPASALQNGDYANWTGGNPDNWGVTESGSNSVEEAAAGGECRIIYNSGSWVGISQNILAANMKYRLEFDIVSITGTLKVDDNNSFLSDTFTTTGHKVIEWTPTSTGMLYFWSAVAGSDIVIDNVVIGNISGTYTSPSYDRGSVVTRRCWPEFDTLFFGTGTVWTDQFNAGDLWTDVLQAGDTWLDLFGQYIAGNLKMKLLYNNDGGSTWNEVEYFESYVSEVQCRYTKYEIILNDVDLTGRIAVQPVTYKEAYWS